VANIWSHLRGKGEEINEPSERFGVSEYPWYGSGYTGNDLFSYGSSVTGSKTESIGNDFIGYINGAYKASGVVFAVCEARRSVFSEMRFAWQELGPDGRPGKLYAKTSAKNSLEILEEPWANGQTSDLLSRAIQDADLAGNFFCVEEIGKGGKKRLRRLRPDWVDIALTEKPELAVKSDILGYVYKPGGTQDPDEWEMYPVDGSNGKIVHWAPIPDPEAQYKGVSWLQAVLNEIMADRQATKHKTKFFQNAAVPNIAVSFKEGVTPEQLRKFKQQMAENHGGVDNAYKTMYLGAGADVHVIGSNIQEMDFKSLQGLAETRIAAAGRVHPAIVGLSEGLAGSSMNEGNFRAAKDGFADGTLRPLWASLCSAFSVLVTGKKNARLWYDMRDIAFLRHDQKELAEIRGIDASTMAKLIMNGYTPESIIVAIENEDWTQLKHTGLYSVQLQPPLTKEEAKAANNKDPKADPNGDNSNDSGNAGSDGKPAKDNKSAKAGTNPGKSTGNSKKPETKSYDEVVEEMRRLDDPNYPEGVTDDEE
jgi:phage portal protein BeeE